MQRTNYCGLINNDYIDKSVILKGWVHRRRDLGGLIFLDLRDREGILQVVIEPNSKCFKIAESIKHEYVIEVNGKVRTRPNSNKEMKTGEVEVIAEFIKILNSAKTIPITIDDDNTSEFNRLTHRIIDLRSQKMQYNLILRYKLSFEIRKYLDHLGFVDIETPFLTRSTPEGARDFLVPSRIHKGSFYALPQSPQLFKQLLMISGFDRYYQIVKCFRDEDLRTDRQPEFTQIDIETSFLNEEEIRNFAQEMICKIFKKILNVELPEFTILKYKDAIETYGSDKPDLRIPIKIFNLTECFKNSKFNLFNNIANHEGNKIGAIVLPDIIKLSRKEIDEYGKFTTTFNATGLTYIKINDMNNLNDKGIQSSILKFLNEDELRNIIKCTNAKNNETILIVADKIKIVNEALGALRLNIGKQKNLISERWKPLWVVDFPMFEFDEHENRYVSCHHPFTSPKDEHIELLDSSPEKCLAKAYDLVLNGWELGGGSIRIHNSQVQSKVFKALNITDMEAYDKFGFLLNNLDYGAPPHGGIAFGLDRIVTLMCNAESIRDVIAFPKTTKGQCLLTNSPNKIENMKLEELGLEISKNIN